MASCAICAPVMKHIQQNGDLDLGPADGLGDGLEMPALTSEGLDNLDVRTPSTQLSEGQLSPENALQQELQRKRLLLQQIVNQKVSRARE